MKSKYTMISLCLSIIVVIISACEKYSDKKGGDIKDQLNRKYCNIPHAINYNWNFPGIEDNTTCYFAYEYFQGNWTFVDTIKKQDEIIQIDTLVISFEHNNADTTYGTIFLNGWCANEKLKLIADRFYNVVTDTMENGEKYQVVCNNQDTISGTISKDISDSTKLSIKLNVTNANGTFLHVGNASR